MDGFFGNGSSHVAKTAHHKAQRQINAGDRRITVGPCTTKAFLDDPKRIGFLFSRYKFVSKMIGGAENVLEVGCQEGLATAVVAAVVEKITAVDFYRKYIEACEDHAVKYVDNVEFVGLDIIDGPIKGDFDAAYSIDVLEHIDPEQEDVFMRNISMSMTKHGTFVVGTPSLEGQKYTASWNKTGHLNCKNGEDLRAFCGRYYHNVFMFGMNDEVIHTGFMPMSQYLFALCVNPKR